MIYVNSYDQPVFTVRNGKLFSVYNDRLSVVVARKDNTFTIGHTGTYVNVGNERRGGGAWSREVFCGKGKIATNKLTHLEEDEWEVVPLIIGEKVADGGNSAGIYPVLNFTLEDIDYPQELSGYN